jgi:hypothetical protein
VSIVTSKIIKFPGMARKDPSDPTPPLGTPVEKPSDQKPVLPVNLTEQQQKAVSCILSGMTFVFIGIQPSDSGADFFTALHGEDADLRNAQDHLPDVISRLYVREGIL